MSAPDQQVTRSNGVSWRFVVGIVLLAAVLVLVLQNTKETTFELFWMSVSAPLWILVVASRVLGFLTPEHARTQSVECVEDTEMMVITYDKLSELYFQNPTFGFYFLRLTSERLLQNMKRLEQELEARPKAATA